MKKIVLMAALTALVAGASSDFHKVEHLKKYKNERLCKVFQEKIVNYQKHMRDDDYARATLASYKKRAAMFCGK